MPSVEQSLLAIRSEIERALNSATVDSKHRFILAARRVEVELAVELKSPPSDPHQTPPWSLEVCGEIVSASASSGKADNSAPSTHRIRIEFEIHDTHLQESVNLPAKQPTGVPRSNESSCSEDSQSKEEEILNQLIQVLGVPSFDTAARSSVMVETLESLTPTQRDQVLQTLDGVPRNETDPIVKRAKHLLSGVIRSGPLKSVAGGGKILADLFGKFEGKQVIQILRSQWKDQEQWLQSDSTTNS